jgi:hypothetical protein
MIVGVQSGRFGRGEGGAWIWQDAISGSRAIWGYRLYILDLLGLVALGSPSGDWSG